MWKKIDFVVSSIEEGITGTLILLCTIILFGNVIARYVFNSASSWAEEAVRYAIIWVVFLGASTCAKNGSHVGLDLFAQILPPKGRKVVYIIGNLFAILFAAACTYSSFINLMLVVNTGQKSAAMLMPMWILYIVIPLGCLLMTIRFIISTGKMIGDKQVKDYGKVEKTSGGTIDLSKLS